MLPLQDDLWSLWRIKVRRLLWLSVVPLQLLQRYILWGLCAWNTQMHENQMWWSIIWLEVSNSDQYLALGGTGMNRNWDWRSGMFLSKVAWKSASNVLHREIRYYSQIYKASLCELVGFSTLLAIALALLNLSWHTPLRENSSRITGSVLFYHSIFNCQPAFPELKLGKHSPYIHFEATTASNHRILSATASVLPSKLLLRGRWCVLVLLYVCLGHGLFSDNSDIQQVVIERSPPYDFYVRREAQLVYNNLRGVFLLYSYT